MYACCIYILSLYCMSYISYIIVYNKNISLLDKLMYDDLNLHMTDQGDGTVMILAEGRWRRRRSLLRSLSMHPSPTSRSYSNVYVFISASYLILQVPGFIQVRHQMAILLFLGMTAVCAMRQNVSVAMVAMVNGSYVTYDEPLGNESSEGVETCAASLATNSTTEETVIPKIYWYYFKM